MDLDNVLEGAKKWAPLFTIIGVILAIIIAAINAFGWSWTVAGFVAIAFLSFILGYIVHSWRSPALPSPNQTTPEGPIFVGTYHFERFNWPYMVEVLKIDIRGSKVIQIYNPICPGCDVEAVIEEIGNFTHLSCPQSGVNDREPCQNDKSRNLSLAGWKDFIRKHIEGDIRKGKIKPVLPPRRPLHHLLLLTSTPPEALRPTRDRRER